MPLSPRLAWSLCALFFAVSTLSAQTYSARLDVADTGTAFEGLIDPANIAIGDSFLLTFEADPFASQTTGDGTTAVFEGAILSYNLTAVSGNAGNFEPLVDFGFTSQVLFSADSGDPNKTFVSVNLGFLDGGTVNFTAEGAGIFNNEGTATLTSFTFNFLVDQPFLYENSGSFSDYTNFSALVPTGTAHFFFSPPGLDEGDIYAEGPAAVPEPGTWALIALGGAVVFLLRRVRKPAGL